LLFSNKITFCQTQIKTLIFSNNRDFILLPIADDFFAQYGPDISYLTYCLYVPKYLYMPRKWFAIKFKCVPRAASLRNNATRAPRITQCAHMAVGHELVCSTMHPTHTHTIVRTCIFLKPMPY
jgi:hypothetical protein